MAFNKKALAPVVSVGLLMVVSVVSVIGFQTWFQSYSSTQYTSVESTGIVGSGSELRIEGVLNKNLYLLKKGGDALNIESVKIGGNECSLASNSLNEGMNVINVTNCLNGLSEGTINDVVVITEKGIQSEKFILDAGY